MAKLKLKQILSKMYYDPYKDQMIISGSNGNGVTLHWNELTDTWETMNSLWNAPITENPFGPYWNLNYNTWDSFTSTWDANVSYPEFVVYGETQIKGTSVKTGSITIDNIDSFGDSGSFYTIDLGTY
jgi:hypothetical protein